MVRRLQRNPIAATVGVIAIAVILAVWLSGAIRERNLDARYSAEKDASVTMMRETARLSLEAALTLREKGDLDGMRRHLPALEEAYRGARERAPQLAEIEYLMGRMHRALMDTDKALGFQEEALRKDPAYGPALYERAVLLARACGPGPQASRPGALVEEGLRPQTPKLRERVLHDLALLLRTPSGFPEGRLLAARGMQAHFEGKQAEARELLERAVKLDPHLDEAWETLGRVTAEQDLAAAQGERERHWLEKEKELTQAILRDKGFLPHLLGRGDLRRDRGNERAARGESPLPDLQAAQEDYSEALRLNPESKEAWLRRAEVLTQRAMYLASRNRDPLADYAEAEKDLDRLAAVAPTSEKAPLWRSVIDVLRGIFLESRGKDPLPDYDRALRDAEEGLKKNPASEDAIKRRAIARLHRAVFLSEAADFDAAEADFAKTRELLPNGPDVRMWQGLLRLKRADFPAAELLLSEAVKLKADYARAWMWLGVARMERGDVDAARKDLSEAIRLNLVFTEAWYWRGVLGLRRGAKQASSGGDPTSDWAKSEEDLAQALALDPGYADAWVERGRLRRERALRLGAGPDAANLWSAAAESWRSALKINPSLQRALAPSLEEAERKSKGP